MLFKVGSFTWNGDPGSSPKTYTVTFVTPFPDAEYSILLSENVYTNSSPIDEIVSGTIRSDLQTASGFRVTRSNDVSDDPAHGVRIYWFAFLPDNLEGVLSEMSL